MKLDLKNLAAPSAMAVDPKAVTQDCERDGIMQPRRLINLANVVFEQGNHLMTNSNVKLPQGSTKRAFKGYEEIHVPAPKSKRDPNAPPDMPTSEMPDWARTGFGSSNKLNRIQTKCYPMAFEDDGNM